MATPDLNQALKHQQNEPRIARSMTLHFVGDWGMANFHRICSWLTQQFCDRAGPDSRVATWSIRYGGIEAVTSVFQGQAQLAIATPAQMITTALTGQGIFSQFGPMPSLRALAVLPQNDRMVLAVDPKFGIRSFNDLRNKRPPLRIATSTNDGTNFIGYTANAYLKAHGITEAELVSWGGAIVHAQRPEQTVMLVLSGKADALLQEAIMTPWWEEVIQKKHFIPLPIEESALERFVEENPGVSKADPNPLPAGFWGNLTEPLPCLDFSDFVILVRDDLPDDVAYLLTWCLVETRDALESQYRHIPPEKSPLTYPLDPKKMALSPVPLHPAAAKFYKEAGYL
ncbi:hypothetical protein BGW36DRAFT_393775 [Talaromyces proteolyticus]|uniref:Uncharacterized protein n=1 Tax=Talaromyces proteolyticus TaxID=1131652 RepID=A0AAD4L2M1_9EURO|nr:uncharacterized protein BGW36DRAFT_393775 [Talaromyces proteolyticus]KAH8703434.1 hypothetical protein BGW36DRAFT_393775 [Talaromyces proteolyticus]